MSRSEREHRQIRARLVRQGVAEGEFDRAFWRDVGPEKRLEALWDMVLEARVWKGQDGAEPRLQRSVLRVQRL